MWKKCSYCVLRVFRTRWFRKNRSRALKMLLNTFPSHLNSPLESQNEWFGPSCSHEHFSFQNKHFRLWFVRRTQHKTLLNTFSSVFSAAWESVKYLEVLGTSLFSELVKTFLGTQSRNWKSDKPRFTEGETNCFLKTHCLSHKTNVCWANPWTNRKTTSGGAKEF